MMTIKAKELKWRWCYVEEPLMEPDKHGRWMVKGYLEVPVGIIPGYDWVAELSPNKTIPLVVAIIKYGEEGVKEYPGYMFKVMVEHVMDLDNGLCPIMYAGTFEEAKLKAQEALNIVARCLCDVAPEPESISPSLVI